MAKASKIALKYHNGALPANLAELLQNADEQDLRILIAVMMLADRESGVAPLEALAEQVGVPQSEVDASIKFWRGAGVLGTVGSAKTSAAPKSKEKTEAKQEKPQTQTQTAHRDGVLEKSGTLTAYSSSELADLMEQRRISAQFVDEAQCILGKIFRTYDTGILVGIVDQLGFEEEAVLALLAYAARRGKKTLRYTEQMAIAFYDEGITETQAVLERINRMERSGEVIAKIRTLFGMGDRELTTSEKKLFSAWTEKYAYDLDVIRLAYDITVDSIQKPVPKYTNSILEKWHTEGLRTVADVQAYLESRQTKKLSEASMKSYDLEDFVEAALQRSYADMK